MRRGFILHDGNHAPKWPFTLNKDSPQAQGLIGWWPLASPAHGRDFSGFGRHASSIAGNVVPGPFGNLVGEFSGDIKNDISRVGLEPSTALTVTAWCRQAAGFGHNGGKVVAKTHTGRGSPWTSYGLDFLSSGAVRALLRTSVDGLQTINGVTYSAGDIIQVVNTYNGSTFSLYSQGTLDNSTGATGTILYSDTNLTIAGPGWSSPQAVDWFDGDIWDVRVYDRAFSASEVWELYAPQTRWDLHHELGRKGFFFVSAGGISDYRFRQRFFG